MRLVALLAAVVVLPGCFFGPRAHTVATEVRVVEKLVPVPCRIDWPTRPTPHVSNVQLTGNDAIDLVLIWRAAEAELEERIAYEKQLEAAIRKCTE